MEKKQLSQKTLNFIRKAQKNEITEYRIYSWLAVRHKKKNPENSKVFQQIADDELKHYNFWKHFTDCDIKPANRKVWYYKFICTVFGFTFGLKIMERGEDKAQSAYETILDEVPEAKAVIHDEDDHETKLIAMLNEQRLEYVGSIVLGLNDALVELTGTLAGLSFALRDTQIIALSGLITGIAASFSMAASEFLSKRTDGESDALKSSVYTGIAYIITVFFLVLPYLVIQNYLVCLGVTLGVAVLIIFFFNYYISVAKDLSFKRRFGEMALISLGVAALSFGVGALVRVLFGVDV